MDSRRESKACLPLLRFDDPSAHLIGFFSGFFPAPFVFSHWHGLVLFLFLSFCPVALSVRIVVGCSLDDNDDDEVEKGFGRVSTRSSTQNQKSST